MSFQHKPITSVKKKLKSIIPNVSLVYQSFQRSSALSKDVVDSDTINEKYQDGVLMCSLSRREEVKIIARMIGVS